ncbi:MAG TPA: galactokinase [Actinomycetes bacterium]|nr:galactokinase [Actinomycetes bacterium]
MHGHARWFAPGRVNLIGDHTDYQLGWVLPFAVAQGTTVTVDLNDTSRLELRSSQFGAAPSRDLDRLATYPRSWASYVDGAVVLLRSEGVAIRGAHIEVDSDLPPGSGLASSAAVTVATLAALLDAAGGEAEPAAVAALAQRVENEHVGAAVGYMDPAAVMFGSAGHALLIDTRTHDVEALALPTVSAGIAFVLFDTGRRHATSGAEYAARVAECARAAAAMSVPSLRDVDDASALMNVTDPIVRARARHVVTENSRVLKVAELLRSGDVASIGAHLVASHVSLRDDFDASTPELDAIVDAALSAGALGARLTGAGFGGAVLAMWRNDEVSAVVDEVRATVASRDMPPPTVREVTPSAGATAVPL